MSNYTPKANIDDYIENNELNSRIYAVLPYLHDCKTCQKNRLTRQPLEIFNHAYAICEELQQEKHPEETALLIWEQMRGNFLLCETNIIFSCVYVILSFSKKENPNIKFCLIRIKHKIDVGYFREFEPLITKELTYITSLTTDFEFLKTEANKIKDLNQRELFYADFLTHYKQANNKGNIVQQISDEIDLIHITKELSIEEKDPTNTASIKVRSVVILELLKKMQLGAANNDLTKICKLISFLTGNSYNSIYNELQKGIFFSGFHSKQISEANKILEELNTSISIDKNRQY